VFSISLGIYTCDINGNGVVTSCDENITSANPPLSGSNSIVVNAGANKAYIADYLVPTLHTCDINSSGVATSCATGLNEANPTFSQPFDVTFNPSDNKLYVIDIGNYKLYTCDIDGSGTATNCDATDFNEPNPNFSQPYGVTYNATANKLYIIDAILRTVYTCNINGSGVATDCDESSFTGANPAFTTPLRAAFNPLANKLYVTDSGNDVLYACEINGLGVVTSCDATNFTGADPIFITPGRVAYGMM